MIAICRVFVVVLGIEIATRCLLVQHEDFRFSFARSVRRSRSGGG